jgi:3-hydroxymyristoyl/3-hydroxydecanoyl-(acyl carrier protein) dehydratase
MRFEVLRLIDSDHPSLPGHFPSAPLVPGVVILDEVAAVVDECWQNSQLSGIRGVKFLAPLKPGQLFTIALAAASEGDGEITFCCRAGERVIVEGRLAVVRGAK